MIPNFMFRQLVSSQQTLLEKFMLDEKFALEMAKHPSHAKLSEWLGSGDCKKVLELGCGPGKYVAMLSSLGFRVVGVDPIDFPSWRLIQDNHEVELHSDVFAERLPFDDASFDHALCLGALLYFDSPQKALRELNRVVKPGGKLILRTVNKENFYTKMTGKKLDPASHHLYSMNELVSLIDASNFSVEHSFSYGFWPPFFTDLWWYLVCVWLPLRLQDVLSDMIDPQRRVNNIVFAVRN